jgi:lysophospholipase L1-like esterase
MRAWLICFVGCFLFVQVVIGQARMLALGDSYTIGESVEEDQRWPNQLATALNEQGHHFKTPEIIAVTGWRTDELIDSMHQHSFKPPYGLVTLLIGVNNQYQERSFGQYEQEFPLLLDRAIALAGDDPSRVVVVSIPDYSYTPFGQQHPRADRITVELDFYNAFARSMAEERGAKTVNITPISQSKDPKLVATDSLHPSGEQYRLWVEEIVSVITE